MSRRRPNTSDGSSTPSPGAPTTPPSAFPRSTGQIGHFFSASTSSPAKSRNLSVSPPRHSDKPSTRISSRMVLSGAVANFASYSPGIHLGSTGSHWAKPRKSTSTAPPYHSSRTDPTDMSWTRSASARVVPVAFASPESAPQPPTSQSLSSLTDATSVSSAPVPSSSTSSARHVPPPRQQHFVEKRRKRHHAYGKKVPYPLSYERLVLDHNDMDVNWTNAMHQSPTAHVFETPPQRVLDLGCGTGAWVLAAAKEWKDTHFIGFDLVPIQANLDLLDPGGSSPYPPLLSATNSGHPPSEPRRGRSGSIASHPQSFRSAASNNSQRPSLSLEALLAAKSVPADQPPPERDDSLPPNLRERVKWVRGDFLETLPFPDGYFDFVHARRIARGVPENKWDHVFSEISRVLKPGGACEIVETNLSFPGSEFAFRPGAASFAATNNVFDEEAPRASFVGRLRRPRASIDSDSPPSPYTLRHQPSMPFATLAHHMSTSPPTHRPMSNFFGSSYAPPPRPPLAHDVPSMNGSQTGVNTVPLKALDPRDHSILEAIYNSMHESRFINLAPLSVIQNYLVLHFGQIATHPPFILLAPRRIGDGLPEVNESFTPTNGVINALDIHEWAKVEFGLIPPPPRPACADDPNQLRVEDFVASDRSRVTPSVPLTITPGSSHLPVRTMNGLPNRTVIYDTGHAGVILSIGLAEVLGCAEEMWEHVRTLDPQADRAMFNELLQRYTTDIQNRIGLRTTLEQRLAWEGHSKGPSPLQKDFEAQLHRMLEEQEMQVRTSTTSGSTRPSTSKSLAESSKYLPEPKLRRRGKMVARTLRVWCCFKE